MSDSLSVAVVTGGHPFDVPHFYRMFRDLQGIDAYVQHLEHFAADKTTIRQSYDCVVYYGMGRDMPDEPVQDLFESLLARGTGLVVLHHGILAWDQWDPWVKVVGISDWSWDQFDFTHDVLLEIAVDDDTHPITKGLTSWQMIDETYSMPDTDADSHVLLSVDHTTSMRHVAWTRQVGASRVFCFQLGHDDHAWSNSRFRRVLRRGILWTARRIG